MDTVVYHTQSLRPKGQSVNPPWREKTKLRERDPVIGFVLVVIDSVCYGFVSLPMSNSDMKLMTVDQFHMESAFKRARNMGIKYSHEFYSHDPLEKVSCDHYTRRVL